MGESTHIQWATDTYNPWRGCRPVSPGCTNCYIVRTPPFRISGQKHGAERIRASEATIKAPLRWNKKPWVCDVCGKAFGSAEAPGSQYRNCWHADRASYHRRRVFCLSLGDWLDDEVPVEWLADLLKVIHQTPNLDWLMLTKRPENWRPRITEARAVVANSCLGEDKSARPLRDWINGWLQGKPPQNVWFGVSIENQPTADERTQILLTIPARVRFLSAEPLLEGIDLKQWIEPLCHLCGDSAGSHHMGGIEHTFEPTKTENEIHWVIFGGESGPKARPCNVDWIREGVMQCQEAGVSTFVKQLGSNPTSPVNQPYLNLTDKKGGDPSEWPEDLRVREFPNVTRELLKERQE